MSCPSLFCPGRNGSNRLGRKSQPPASEPRAAPVINYVVVSGELIAAVAT